MRFEKSDLIEIARMHKQEGLSCRSIAAATGFGKSTINNFLSRRSHKEFWERHDEKPVAGGEIADPIVVKESISSVSDKKVFIFTSAQSNTHIHDKFLRSLQQCAKHRDAQIIVGTFKYNMSAYNNDADEIWFDPKITDYVVDRPIAITKDLVWCGELNILPTAVNPISGLNNYTGPKSSIIPHAKVQLESVPSAKQSETKMIYTTGAVTQSNYIQKKAGQKGAHNHIYGATIVEVDSDGTWFARQLIAESKTGEFYDLDNHYTPNGHSKSESVLAINWGDIHIEKLDDTVGKVSFGVGMNGEDQLPHLTHTANMLDDLRPQYTFYHDIIDFKVRNHHNRKNPLFKIKMSADKTEAVDFGLRQCGELLSHTKRDFCQQVVVNSNHDAALQKWAVECNWGEDPINAEFLLECQLALVKAVKANDGSFCIFEHMTKSLTSVIDGVKFLRLDESFVIGGENGIECGYHGHTGNNGARGGTQGYRIAGVRYNIGHQHSAGIKDGVYIAGVSAKLDMGYNVGMGSWSHSHIVTYKNSKRAIVTIKNGRYRGEI